MGKVIEREWNNGDILSQRAMCPFIALFKLKWEISAVKTDEKSISATTSIFFIKTVVIFINSYIFMQL